ncbi:MAG: transposase [Candidatus Aminicenantes bacterium]|nr:MAG: transposase [Candidatus Aminicenantes bacterium]
MPRGARGLSEGSIYHVLNRGNGKQEVFHKDQDFVVFIRIMKEAKKRYPLNIFAYCLMPNHFHIVLKPNRANHLSNWIQLLMTSHVRRYHNHYQTNGHIWQGRYKNFIIQRDEHLLTVLRYVEANPIRAGLVSSARDWLWSSHNERICDEIDGIVDNPPIDLPSDWARYVDEPLRYTELGKLHQSVNRQSPYGNAEWQREMIVQLGLQHTIRPRGRPKKEADADRQKKGDRQLF